MKPDFEAILREARRRGASDIHLRAGLKPAYRIDGCLVAAASKELSRDDISEFVASTNVCHGRGAFFASGDFDVALQIDNQRYRLHVFVDPRAIGVVMRVLPETVPTLASLGMPPIVRAIAENRAGLVLVTGAAGSGKTTTLAAMVNEINETRPVHIVTLEDPIEILHSSKRALITQREVMSSGLTFSGALRSALRQDPDVILVGELRDADTAQLACTAAETGHLVLATLHSRGAVESVSRLLDLFPTTKQGYARCMVADSLRAVVSQQLYPSTKGGRVACTEVLVGTTAVRNLIREGKNHQLHGVMQASGSFGMVTMEQRLLQMEAEGLVRSG